MRNLLDRLYAVCGVLAGISLAAIAVLVLAQTFGRLLGIVVPAANELAGYCVAASAFLGLAPTLNSAAHIRVRLITQNLPPALRRWVEAWCLAVALGLTCFAAWFAVDLVIGSWRFGDVSPGLLAVPLWIPQTAMAAGLVVFAVCLADNLLRLISGAEPLYAPAEADELGR